MVNTIDGIIIKAGIISIGFSSMPVKGGFFMTKPGGLVMTVKSTVVSS